MANLKGKGGFFEDKNIVSDICKWCCIHAGKNVEGRGKHDFLWSGVPTESTEGFAEV